MSKYLQPGNEITAGDITAQIAYFNNKNAKGHEKYLAKREKTLHKLFAQIVKSRGDTIKRAIRKKKHVEYPLEITTFIKKRLVCNVRGCSHKINTNLCDYPKTKKIVEEKLRQAGYKYISFVSRIEGNSVIGYRLCYTVNIPEEKTASTSFDSTISYY